MPKELIIKKYAEKFVVLIKEILGEEELDSNEIYGIVSAMEASLKSIISPEEKLPSSSDEIH